MAKAKQAPDEVVRDGTGDGLARGDQAHERPNGTAHGRTNARPAASGAKKAEAAKATAPQPEQVVAAGKGHGSARSTGSREDHAPRHPAVAETPEGSPAAGAAKVARHADKVTVAAHASAEEAPAKGSAATVGAVTKPGHQGGKEVDAATKPAGGKHAEVPAKGASAAKAGTAGAHKAPRAQHGSRAPEAEVDVRHAEEPRADKPASSHKAGTAVRHRPAEARVAGAAGEVAEATAGAEPGAAPPDADEALFLEHQRELLVEERNNYMRQAEELRAQAEALALEHEPGDVQFDEEGGEGGTSNVDRELDLHLSAQAQAAIEEIDAALAKIEAGTYGLCENCGSLIPRARLEALPHARLCVACKSGGLTARRQ